jgi:hypothetical protein
MNLMDVGHIVEPIRLIGTIPGAFCQSVTSLLFTETSQCLRRLSRDPALTGGLNKGLFGVGCGARRTEFLVSANRRSA